MCTKQFEREDENIVMAYKLAMSRLEKDELIESLLWFQLGVAPDEVSSEAFIRNYRDVRNAVAKKLTSNLKKEKK